MKSPYILAIGSFAVHGTASLKTFITFLGEKVLPVPSLMLNGLTNMAMVKKFETPFKELLESTFELAINRDLELILYIGYLGNSGQAGIITEMITKFQKNIKIILTDPVCGDHGRAYVSAEIIASWPELIKKSDIAFPNITEIKILTGYAPDAKGSTIKFVNEFRKLFPKTQLVLTSDQPDENTIGLSFYGEEAFKYSTEILPRNFGGTGDAFVAFFILNRFYNQSNLTYALKKSADYTFQIIKNSIEQNSDDLILSSAHLIYNNKYE